MQPEPLPPPSPDLARALVGVWTLVSREDYDADSRRRIDPFLGSDPIGILTFSETRFAAQFMKRDRETTAAPPPTAATPAAAARVGSNNSVAVGGYDAYFGTYRVDTTGGRIATLLEGALTPANVGQEFTRDVRVVGDRLILRLSTTTPEGIPITRTNTFIRA